LLAARKGADTLEALDSHEKALFAISTAAVKDEGTKASDGIAARVARRLSGEKRDTGLSTGFSDLDRIIGGLRPGELAIIGARPSIGKSTLALDLARHVALDNHSPVAFFSLEMTEDEIWDRIIAAEASVPLKKVRGDEDLDDDEITAVLKTADRAQNCALTVYDKASVNVPEIKAKCRRHKKKNGLALVVVDYIQLLTTMGKNMESRQVEVSEFSRQMKLLAKELNVPVIVCAQLNRLTEQQGPVTKTNSAGETVKVTPPPKLSHLRESGSLEQDADLVILLHRDDFYDKNVRPGEADLIVAKHRNGPTGTVTVASQLHYSRFANMAAEA
jgi:replicative DNA helicase